MERRSLFDRWPTGAILLLLLTAALLPLGLVLAWFTQQNLRETNTALVQRADQQGSAAFQAIESLLARNALALRVAANGALASRVTDPCETAARTLAIAPAVARQFRIRDPDGRTVCSHGQYKPERDDLLVAPGDIKLWVSPQQLLVYRVGLIGGNATGVLTRDELRQAADDATDGLKQLTITDGANEMPVITAPIGRELRSQARDRRYDLAGGQVQLRTVTAIERTTLLDLIVLLLPLLMWVAATLLSWMLVRRLLLAPLARLQRAVTEYQPDTGGLDLPNKFGVASEIEDLSSAFERAVGRIEGAEREALDALDGQRRLVREVHHRVKNNLQVVASLLSIHGRSAAKPEAKAAYSAIGRRVDALSVVHRHHYAELEENRGIALRPLLTELAADLRSSAPVEARGMRIELDLDAPSTTQDVAVAAAFLITEIVEFAMLRHPEDSVEIQLRREGDLTATLAIASSVLVPEGDPSDIAKNQFERIVEGLARQLRSPLDRKLGRYVVTLPIFPDA
ncbi:MAG TPA: histidine kinase dimerization/phosphoacceptor domain -containing protein [Sphingomicrobium sp.]|nr:histidine kinase dimerization/phosphoacceptor domain -containing protein [Sphingomicrobium sp.]